MRLANERRQNGVPVARADVEMLSREAIMAGVQSL